MQTKQRSAAKKLPESIASSKALNVGELRHRFGISQSKLARITGYSVRAIADWESGKVLSPAAKQKLTETDRLSKALSGLLPEKELNEWMSSPNPAFEGQTPIHIIERGETDRIWQMIFEIQAGVAS
jgi:transcriptional regulator with XRE-family HTH domain